MRSRAPTLGMAAGAQTADNRLWTTLRACERQLLTPGCGVPRCAAGSGAGPVVPGPEQMRAVVLTLQESDRGDRGVEAESCCAFMLLPLQAAGQRCRCKSRGDPRHVCTSVAVVHCSFWIFLSLQIINVASSGHPHFSWNKCRMPNNYAASGCFAI